MKKHKLYFILSLIIFIFLVVIFLLQQRKSNLDFTFSNNSSSSIEVYASAGSCVLINQKVSPRESTSKKCNVTQDSDILVKVTKENSEVVSQKYGYITPGIFCSSVVEFSDDRLFVKKDKCE
jgi:preprotein translocase subunit SecF